DALRPTALVFSKLDVWPTLVARAAARGVRLGLVSATLAPGAGRRGRVAGLLLHDAYRALDRVGAIDGADADRLVTLGVRRNRVEVTGDTRYDQVWERARALALPPDAAAALAVLADSRLGGGSAARDARFTLVAGSTWPADEGPLGDAWLTLRRQDARARLILAPHEPTPAHLASLEQWVASNGLRRVLWSALLHDPDAARDADVVLVDRVGVLAELYAAADAAFVGGGFHAAGLHSVLEPAAFGVPVAFGPRHGNSRDAGLLIAAGGADAAPSGRTLAELLRRWRTSEMLREQAGAAARAVVEGGLGADRRTWALVRDLLGNAS
ncbi:MAG TPA: glycosyltransferase N-terminal domain-containing protein, partial [Gemmatirosa sp.]